MLTRAVWVAAVLLPFALPGQEKELPGSKECLDCHEAGRRTGKRQAGMPPPFDAAALRGSPHAGQECAGCHGDIDPKKLPHEDKVAPVNCGNCHPDEGSQYEKSLHGIASARGDKTAPGCKVCHGTHGVRRIPTVEVPKLCGQCHREGTPVSQTHSIPQTNILENYRDSIHGEGLFKRGLTVTAVCTSCHTAHQVLPHDNPQSSIAKQNIAKTCTKCHAQIE
ncbi:MAG: cytochrome c3 family protein, partial [Candidatus Eisenbacteria bacterium]|nr:cytochrome c3 family protein [Candidatus Eisenbacteria bacterium]